MKSKHKAKLFWGCIILIILGIITYFYMHTVYIEDTGRVFWDSTKPFEDINDAEEIYYVKFKIERERNYVSESDFDLYDDKKSQVPIQEFIDNSDLSYEVWFSGQAEKKYHLVYHDQFFEKKFNVEFHTPNQKSIAEKPSQIVKSYIKKHLYSNVTNKLYDEVLVDPPFYVDIFANMKPYYTPSDNEKKAIFQAYWETYIKNWEDYKVEMTEAGSSSYYFNITYHWDEPDMEELNRKIDERENQLKKEFGDDYKAVFKKIIAEIPKIIKNTPPKESKEEKTDSLSLKKDELQTLSDDTYTNRDLWIPREYIDGLQRV